MELILFFALSLLIVIAAFNFPHWYRVIRHKLCKVGYKYTSPWKDSKAYALITDKDRYGVKYKVIQEDGSSSPEAYISLDQFFENWGLRKR